MKNYSLAVTTTEKEQDLNGVKYLKMTVGTTAVLINVRMTQKQQSQADLEDFVTLDANKTYYIRARRNKAAWALRYKTASGSSTLSVVAGNEEFFLDDPTSALATLAPYIYNGSGGVLPANFSLKDYVDAIYLALGGTTTSILDRLMQSTPDAVAIIHEPLVNEWYTLFDTLATSKRTRLCVFALFVGGFSEGMEIKITVGTTVWTYTGTFTADTWFYIRQFLTQVQQLAIDVNAQTTTLSGGFVGKGVKVEIRKTTDLGVCDFIYYITSEVAP